MSEHDQTDHQTAQDLLSKLNRETSKIRWSELQRFYASGAVINVHNSLDLLQVACQFSEDNKSAVEGWLQQGSVARVDDALAQRWWDQNAEVWAVVIAPWVLVQEPKTV